MQTCFSWPCVFIQIFISIFCSSWFFGIFPLWCLFCCYFQNYVMMTICKMRDKPYDTLTNNRTANMTSMVWATRLVNECGVKRSKELSTTDQRPKSEENYHPAKQFTETLIQTVITDIGLKELSTSIVFKLSSSSCVIVIVAIWITIELIKQTWFLLAKKDSLTEGSSAN